MTIMTSVKTEETEGISSGVQVDGIYVGRDFQDASRAWEKHGHVWTWGINLKYITYYNTV